MATEEYSIGYQEGRRDGWNAAMDSLLPAQRTWVGLTDEERQACINYRAVEAKLKEKNT